MLIQEKPLRYWIDKFYGYGSWQANIWFIAYEDSGGEVPDEVAEKINYFFTKQAHATDGSLCDIRDLYRHITITFDGPKANSFKNLFEYRFGKNAVTHGVWKNLIAFAHGFKSQKIHDLVAYQREAFVSPSMRNEALIKLYPLPGPHSHSWYYSWLDLPQLPFLKKRTLYEAHVYHHRINNILSNISSYKPEVVLMYGMNNINLLKASIQQFFPGASFKMVKATKRQIPQHHRADLNGTTLLITTQLPALRHNRVETGFDWEIFGAMTASPSTQS